MKTNMELANEANLPACQYTHPKAIERFAALVRADEREENAKVCEGQIKIFLSPQYKTGQPMSSFGERHAVASCVEAIRARGNT